MKPLKLTIKKFSYRYAQIFSKLRRDIDNESEYVLGNKGERKENALHVIVRLLISQRRMVTFLAFDDDFVIGYVSLVFPRFSKMKGNTYLTISVREAYRGKGVGSALMETAEKYAQAQGMRRIELEVFGKNKNAIALYAKRGYVVEGTKKDAVYNLGAFDDIIIMTKRIGA